MEVNLLNSRLPAFPCQSNWQKKENAWGTLYSGDIANEYWVMEKSSFQFLLIMLGDHLMKKSINFSSEKPFTNRMSPT